MSDRIMSISAMITALIAVVISIFEIQTNREFQRLSVEPYLEVSYSNINGYKVLLINSGIGPARIKTVNVELDGTAVSNWDEVTETLTGRVAHIIYSSLWDGRQIRAEEEVALMYIAEAELAAAYDTNSARVNLSICYCSIYGDCWLKENLDNPVVVHNCPNDGGKRFPVY